MRANERTDESGPVLQSVLLAVIDHSASGKGGKNARKKPRKKRDKRRKSDELSEQLWFCGKKMKIIQQNKVTGWRRRKRRRRKRRRNRREIRRKIKTDENPDATT